MPIFSTYSQQENQVTATFLEVLQHLPIRQIDRLLGELTGVDTLKFIDFRNQPTRKTKESKNSSSVPDAQIKGSGHVLIETKIESGSLGKTQLSNHLEHLGDDKFAILLALTPDEDQPPVIDEIKMRDNRIRWANFQMLVSAIDSLLKGEADLVSEKEHFLLHEFKALLNNAGLLKQAQNTVIVHASGAWEFYIETAAYVCQPNRSFRAVEYLGFYLSNSIKPVIPKILKTYDEVILDADLLAETNADSELVEKVKTITNHSDHLYGGTYKVMLLSAEHDRETKTLEQAIQNNLTNNNDRRYAFTQNQRYVSLDNLTLAKTTEKLIALEKAN